METCERKNPGQINELSMSLPEGRCPLLRNMLEGNVGMDSRDRLHASYRPAFLVIVAAWLVLAWPWLSDSVTVPWDAKAHFQPQLAFLAQSLQRGESPFWTPNVFAGHPQIADPQSLIFSPPFLILSFFRPSPDLADLDLVLYASLLVGAVFVLLYFRDRRWHPAAAVVASVSFAFGGAAAWRIQHVGQVMSIAYFPIALWLLDRALRRSGGFAGLLYGFLAGIVAGFMLLGRDQVAYLGLITLACYAIHRLAADGWMIRRAIGPLAFGGLGGIIVVTVPMVMTLLLAADSNRPVITLSEAGKGSLHPWSLLTAIIPHLYGISRPLGDYWGPPSPDWGPVDLYLARNMATFYFGVLPLLGLLLFPFLVRFRPRFAGSPEAFAAGQDPHRGDALFLFCGFLALMLYSLGRYTPFFGIVFSLVPGIDKFRRPADALFVACALGSMAGGYAVHRWITAPAMRLPTWATVVFIAAVLACGAAGAYLAASVGRLAQAMTPIAAAACFLAAGTVSLQLLRRMGARSALLPIVAGIVMLFDLGWNNAPNESTGLNPDSYAVLRPGTTNETIRLLTRKVEETRAPDRIDRVELAGLGFHWPNASMIHGLHNTLGYNPVRSAIYSASVGAGDHVAGPDQRLFTPLMPSYRSVMADLVGLRYIATGVPMEELYRVAGRAPGTPPATFQPADFPLIARTPDAYVYENPRALPRVLFPANGLQADFTALIRTGAWPDVDPRRTVLLERAVAPRPLDALPDKRSVRIVSYRNTEVVVEAESETGGFVVLNDSWDDWWRVEIDGAPARLERANVAFRAVEVPPGKHTVRFVFRPFRGALAELLGRR